MNNTISTTCPAQAFETTFNISDYVNFNFVFETPHESVDTPSDISVVHPFQSMTVHDPLVGFVDAADTEFAGTFQLPGDCNVLGNSVNATQAAPEDIAMTDAIQTAFETDASCDDFNVFKSTAFAQSFDSGALETTSFPSNLISPFKHVLADHIVPDPSQIMHDPSIWLPVPPQVQQHLNTVYASELVQQLNVPNPAQVLFFPAKEPLGLSTSSNQSPSNDVHAGDEPSQTARPELQTTLISPSLLMHESPTLPQDLFSNGMHSPFTQTIDEDVLDIENLASALPQKRTVDTNEHDPEPALKRIRTAQAGNLPPVAKDDDTDDDDEPVITRGRTTRQISLPIAAKDDDSVGESKAGSEGESENNRDDRSCESDNSGSLSAPSSLPLPPTSIMRTGPSIHPRIKHATIHGPNWRYEQAQEVRLREQRRKEWNQKRTNPLGAKGKAPSRKMQKLLKEIEDSEGFAEAQGNTAEEGVESDEDRGPLRRRPVRKEAKKSYVGQE